MSELDDIISVFGEVDNVMVADRTNVSDVAALLPDYAREPSDPDAPFGWYAELVDWLARTQTPPGPAAPLFPTIEEALLDLSARPPPEGTLATRRLLGLAALCRAAPGRFGPDGTLVDEVRGALRPLVPDDGEVDGLHVLLADPVGPFRTIGDWESFIDETTTRGLTRPGVAIRVPPCQATDVVRPNRQRPVTILRTEFTTAAVSLRDVQAFLDPANWPTCAPLWCAMAPLPQFRLYRRFLEEIGSGCEHAGSWRLRTGLDFVARARPGAVAVGYRRADDQEATGGDGWIEVDEGAIEAREVGDGRLCITTVKRLRFKGLALGKRFGVALCALGWAAVGQDMALRCAGHRRAPYPWAPDPVGAPGAVTAAAADAVIAAVEEVVGITSAALTAYSGAFAASWRKIARGEYRGEDLAADVNRSLQQAAEDASRVAIALQVLAPPGGVPPTGQTGDRQLETETYPDPRTGPNQTLELDGLLMGDFGVDLPARVHTFTTPEGQAFTVQCTVPVEYCGTFWGDVVVVTGSRRGTPTRVGLVVS